MITEENKSVEVFGTKEVSVKEFMGSSDKSLVLLSDHNLAKENLEALNEKHEARVTELVAIEELSPSELKELNTCRAELREPRYLIQNIEKNNISVFESYKKTDKANLKELIDINRELEDKASEKIKLEEERKKLEKEAEAKAEENRISKIKTEIDNIETYCSEIVQKMTFENMKVSAESIEQSLNSEYDFEEYDLLFDQVKARVTKSLLDKTNDITAIENQRLENEAMKQEIFDVRVARLSEFGLILNDSDFFRSIELSITYSKSELMNIDSATFERAIENIKKVKEEAEKKKRDAEIQKQKDEQFEVRKNRIFELGFGITNNLHFFFSKEFPDVSVNTELVFQASVTEFEEILSKAKQDVICAAAKVVSERFEHRKNTLIELGFEYKENEAPCFNDDKIRMGVDTLLNSSDEWFNNEVYLLKQVLEKEGKKKADAENKSRVKRLAKDKELLSAIVDTELTCNFDIKSENEETKNFVSFANLQIGQLKADLLTQLNDL